VVSPDGRIVASTAFAETSVRLWDTESGRQVRVLTGHEDSPMVLSFSADGKALATYGYDGTIRIWDTSQGKQTGKIVLDEAWKPGSQTQVYASIFRFDGRRLSAYVTSSGAGERRLEMRDWDVPSLKETSRTECIGVDERVPSPNGKFLACRKTTELSILQADSGMPMHSFSGNIEFLSFTPDSRFIALLAYGPGIPPWVGRSPNQEPAQLEALVLREVITGRDVLRIPILRPIRL